MDVYRVSFIGHRVLDDYRFVEEQLYSIVANLIRTKEYVEFYVGRNGDFDILAASVIKRAKRDIEESNSSLILVIAYPIADMEAYKKYYDEVEYPKELLNVHYKNAITKRNEWLIEHSDMLVAFVTRSSGGAARCLKKAIEHKIKIKLLNRTNMEQQQKLGYLGAP